MGKEGETGSRTTLEKYLIGAVIVLALTSIGLLVGLIVVATTGDDHDHDTTVTATATTTVANTTPNPDTTPVTDTTPNPLDNLCLTPGCIETANMLVKNMNMSADPCEDFYAYACGKFVAETVIPDDKTSVSAFSVIDNQMMDHLRIIINEEVDPLEILPFQNLKNLNKACLNLDKIEELGTAPILDKITELGGWPVTLPSSAVWDDSEWTWENVTAKLRSHGYSVSSIFSFSVITDPQNSLRRTARIDQTSLGLAYEYITKRDEDAFYRAYKEYQVDLVKLLAPEIQRDVIVAKMAEALEFEYTLANISLSREERRDATKLYNPMTISELQGNYSYIDWLPYLNSLMPSNAQFSNEDIIINAVPEFFTRLQAVLNETSNEVKANYLMWRVASSAVSYLPKVFRDRQQVYTRITTGREEADPRGLTCANLVLSYFPHALGGLYVRKHFDESAKANVNEMVDNIMEAFKGILNEIDWMDPATKVNARAKANSMKSQMAYADELREDSKLVEYYTARGYPEVDADSYYDSVLNIGKASTNYSLSRLRQPVDKDEWSAFVAPAVVNAFYSSLENTIKFPAGILQGAFFNPDRPHYMNYGGIGFVIGHEITHGFDDQGSRYDADGNLNNWWDQGTRTQFEQRAQCIIDQYSGYREPQTGLYVKGINTQGENIADNGGIKESYYAYEELVRRNGEEKKLPGVDLTPKQLFWVSAGQVWCNKQRDASLINRIETGVHSPSQFRVNGPMSNSHEFARDFGCPADSNMNPALKCSVW